MPRWIVYAAFGIWISAAFLDVVIAVMRVLIGTREYGLPVRPTWSYFLIGIVSLCSYGALTWLLYSDHIGEWSALIAGTLLAIPPSVHLLFSAPSSPELTREQEPPTSGI